MTHFEMRETYDGIRDLLDRFDAEDREPDRWEELHLASAIDYLEHGSSFALSELQMAKLPAGQRSTALVTALAHLPQRHTKTNLRAQLARLDALVGGC